MKGWIALDLDGTLTDSSHKIPQPVIDYLRKCVESGYLVLFVTGRLHAFAHALLGHLDFPFFFAIQNGADIFLMPEELPLSQNYLDSSIIPLLEEVFEEEEEDFILYSGYEAGDFCYWRPSRFSPRVRAHLESLKPLSPTPWKEVDYESFSSDMKFSLIKAFGSHSQAKRIHKKLLKIPNISLSYIEDPLSKNEIYLNLITHPLANKGATLRTLIEKEGRGDRVIAAGDDRNDLPLLLEADIKIVMEKAPPDVKKIADLIAPPSDQMGIIHALEKVL